MLFQWLLFLHIIWCSQSNIDDDASDHNVELAGGNVKLITTKESWDQKIAEAETDKKLVSTTVTLLLLLDASIAPSYMNASTCIACIDM